MSGFQNITGFQAPTSISSFMDLLQTASFRGVPFKVVSSHIRKGRKFAIHDYPFRDGGWAEDMGRALRTYSFTGYLIGDIAPALQLALDLAVETPGAGLLIHPSVGAQMVSVLSCATAIRKDAMRVIEVHFEFIEQNDRSILATLIATAVSVLSYAGIGRSAGTSDFQADAAPALTHGSAVTAAAVAVVNSFATLAKAAGQDPAAAVRVTAALPGYYGRYAAGAVSTAAPASATVESLIAGVTAARAALAAAIFALQTTVASLSATVDIMAALSPVTTALAATASDPADLIRVLSDLAGFALVGVIPLNAAVTTIQTAMADAVRRAVVIAMAEASASYQPTSYQDAAALRDEVTAALDAEITIAGDAGDDASYSALRSLRTAVADDLMARGANVAAVETVLFRAVQPALTVAYSLYGDASRSDDVTRRANPPHPAFCPTVMQLLAS